MSHNRANDVTVTEIASEAFNARSDPSARYLGRRMGLERVFEEYVGGARGLRELEMMVRTVIGVIFREGGLVNVRLVLGMYGFLEGAAERVAAAREAMLSSLRVV